MTLGERLSRELDGAIEQASVSATTLTAIGAEMQAVLSEDRHAPALSAQVLAAQAKRAALAVTSLAGLVGRIEALVRISAI